MPIEAARGGDVHDFGLLYCFESIVFSVVIFFEENNFFSVPEKISSFDFSAVCMCTHSTGSSTGYCTGIDTDYTAHSFPVILIGYTLFPVKII